MKLRWSSLGWTLGLFLSIAPNALAVRPAPVQLDTRVQWSTVIRDPFDGPIVHDKHFSDQFAFISSWSKSSIRATYRIFEKEQTGYTTVWETRTVRDRHGKRRTEDYPVQRPTYRTIYHDRTPQSIRFAINGQQYEYTEGEVSPELAAALATAPEGNLVIRVVWSDGGTMDVPIGKATVQAWRTIFK